MDKYLKQTSLIFQLTLFIISFTPITKGQQLKAEEIVTKHLSSIGTAETRDAVINRIAVGDLEFTVRTPNAKLLGKAVLASDQSINWLLASTLDSPDYPSEKIGLFKGKLNISLISPGMRSPLGNYLLTNGQILSQGLLAGTILPSWFLLNPEKIQGRIEFGGKKAIDGIDTYILNYKPNNGFSADSSIKLYFDVKNFRHLRTEFRQNIARKENYKIGIFGGQTGDTTNLLIEDFRDFNEINGLTLPNSYKISLILDGQLGTIEFHWNFVFHKILMNQKLTDDFFKIEK